MSKKIELEIDQSQRQTSSTCTKNWSARSFW